MEVLVGTYEEFVIGFRLIKEDEKYSLKQSFTDHSQCGSIRCIGVAGKFLASGSTDESIKVYDLKKRIDYGNLHKHNGTITCIDGFKSTHLLSGSEDGTICIWRTRGWECDRTLLHAHKGGVTSLSIHPSGKLALSVGKDRSLKTWNLIKARTAYVKNLHAVGDLVLWSPEGLRYVVVTDSTLNVFSTETAEVLHTVKTKGRIHKVTFITEDFLAVASESPEVELHDLVAKALVISFAAHEKRVKAINHVKLGDEDFLLTGSNDGFVKVWKLKIENLSVKPKLLCQQNTGCRITCMSVWKGSSKLSEEEEEKKVNLTEEVEEDFEPQEEIVIREPKRKMESEDIQRPKKKKRKSGKSHESAAPVEPVKTSKSSDKVKRKKKVAAKSKSGFFEVDSR